MSGFVASPPATPVDQLVDADGWWPALSLSAFRQSMRLPPQVEDTRLRDALVAGMIAAARDLGRWRAERQAAGAASLAAIPAPVFGGESELIVLWRRAAFSLAAADLADTHSDITATAEGRDRNESRAVTADEHRRNALQAIRAIKGCTRNRAVLK